MKPFKVTGKSKPKKSSGSSSSSRSQTCDDGPSTSGSQNPEIPEEPQGSGEDPNLTSFTKEPKKKSPRESGAKKKGGGKKKSPREMGAKKKQLPKKKSPRESGAKKKDDKKPSPDEIPAHIQAKYKKLGAIPKRMVLTQASTSSAQEEIIEQVKKHPLEMRRAHSDGVFPEHSQPTSGDKKNDPKVKPVDIKPVLEYYASNATPTDVAKLNSLIEQYEKLHLPQDERCEDDIEYHHGACALPDEPVCRKNREGPYGAPPSPRYTFESPDSQRLFGIEEYVDEDGWPLYDPALYEDPPSREDERYEDRAPNCERDLAPYIAPDQEPSPSFSPNRNQDGLEAIFGPLVYDYNEYDLSEDPDDCNLLMPKEEKKSVVQGAAGDSPDLDFTYDDADTHGNEVSELYSYTEQPELQLNVKAFEDQMEIYNLPPCWQRLSVEQRSSVVMKLLDQLESSKKPVRMRSARCLLYIAQGCWAEVQSDTEQQHWTRINALMLFQQGAFCAFTDLLNIEIDNSTAAHVAMRKVTVSLADSQDLRVILSVLYIITEVIRNEKLSEESEFKADVEAFVFEVGHGHGEDNLVIKLLSMVTRFCSGAAPHFPMKKVLLLLWKLTLVGLGGMNTLKEMKAEKRRRSRLPPQDEDTMEIAKTMRSSSPPASASDLLEAQNQKRSTRPMRRSLMKQSSLDDQESLSMEMETSMGNENGDDLADMTEYDERRPTDNSEASQMFNNHIINMYNMQVSPPPQHDVIPRGLPWKPKVRQKDIDAFLDTARLKFLGYTLGGDRTTLFGLPEPIHEGVRILKEHVYTSLAELQIQKEEEIARNPISTKEEEIELTPTEILYQAMLPNLPQYMIALLKILLAAAPTSKSKTESINIMADVLPEEMPMTVLQSMKLGIDVNRHKEIIVKAVSAILLLLLKHFKLNHIYQFEFMSQHLVFANCIPLVLKFFNQNIMGYIGAKHAIPILDFPSCVIGDQPELTTESLEIGDAAPFSWRNIFSCINLLRILNKLTKWKHSRIMMLVVFKSAPILKRTLKIRHAMTQLYVLKLLKMQTKYLGRQWRKSNMKTISAIYQKVRHRLNDDWAYGNDLDARPWDFQAEECALRASVDRFNNRRYTQLNDSEFEPVENNPSSILGKPYDLSENFKRHYTLWLEQEVYANPIDWEKLLLECSPGDISDDKNGDP